jgi:hypothetical protein
MSYMVNNIENIPHDKTFYTTPKMVAGSVAGDVIWQLGCQYIDPRFENATVGEMGYEWFASIIYPIALMMLIGGIAHAHSRYACGSQSDWESIKEANNKKYAEHIEEDKAIAGGIFFGMLGWMLGYIAADEELGFGFNDAQTTVAVGAGSAVTLMLYSVYTDYKNNKLASKETYAVAATSFFLGSASWYLCYILPGIMVANGFPENKMVSGFVSALATGVASAASLGLLYMWENRGDKKADKPAVTASLTF